MGRVRGGHDGCINSWWRCGDVGDEVSESGFDPSIIDVEDIFVFNGCYFARGEWSRNLFVELFGLVYRHVVRKAVVFS